MSESYKAFKPLAGNQYQITFNYDDPQEKDGEWGPYWIWGITESNIKKSWLINKAAIISMLRRGDVKQGSVVNLAVVQVMSQQGRPYNTFEMRTQDGKVHYSHQSQSNGSKPSPENEPPHPAETTTPPESDLAVPENGAKEAENQKWADFRQEVFNDMEACLDQALNLRELIIAQANPQPVEDKIFTLTTEDVRTLAITMFINLRQGKR